MAFPAILATPLREHRAPKAHDFQTVVEDWVRDHLVGWALTSAVVAMTCVAVAVVSRWMLVRVALKRRERACQLLPTDTFHPTPEEIGRHATLLVRAHRASGALGARRAAAVRLRLSTVEDEFVYHVEGSRRARSLLGQSGYREAEAVPVRLTGDGGESRTG